MLGLAFLFICSVYLIISLIVINTARKFTKRRYQRGWIGGFIALLVMYNLLFWDLIPVYIGHEYLCKNDAKVEIYKTLEQWKKENPGVAETLRPSKEDALYSKDKRTSDYYINQRFVNEYEEMKIWYVLRKQTQKIIDRKNGEVLAQLIDFDTDIMGLAGPVRTPIDLKFWLDYGTSCESGNPHIRHMKMNDFIGEIQKLGSE